MAIHGHSYSLNVIHQVLHFLFPHFLRFPESTEGTEFIETYWQQMLNRWIKCKSKKKHNNKWINDCHNNNKKAVLSQRWPRNATYIWVAWTFSGLPWLRPRSLFPTLPWAFVPIDPVNVPTKFEVCSFTRAWDNRGYQKKFRSPWIRPWSLFSKIFNGLLFG